MIDSLAGALLQSITFVAGMTALLLLVALLCLTSWPARPRPATQEEPALAPFPFPERVPQASRVRPGGVAYGLPGNAV